MPSDPRLIRALDDRGVILHAPESTFVEDLDPSRFEPGVEIFPGCTLRGRHTLVGAGSRLGRAGGGYFDSFLRIVIRPEVDVHRPGLVKGRVGGVKRSADDQIRIAVIVTLEPAGEEIARAAYELVDAGYRRILLNLTGTKIINSIGISILIEIIEKMIEVEGKLAFCALTPTIEKTFHIMGLAQYAAIFSDEESALAEIAAPSS